jgi:hypothetical protein
MSMVAKVRSMELPRSGGNISKENPVRVGFCNNSVTDILYDEYKNFDAKIAKGERRAKRKRSFQVRAKPSRLPSYVKIAKGERRAKRKRSFQVQAMPSRLPFYRRKKRERSKSL